MRTIVMLYGLISYLLFFGVFLYLIAFNADIFVPKTLSSVGSTQEIMSPGAALLINIVLLLLWGVQHTVMARGWFKEAIAHVIPHHTERSTYVLASTLVLALLMYAWQPIEGVIWQVENTTLTYALWAAFGLGWVLVLISTFLTDHFDLFGLRQTWLYFIKKTYTSVGFTERLFYRWIRHPMMLGLLIAFWAVPTMSVSHLVFSLGMTFDILFGIYFEEKGLAATLGPEYVLYRQRTARVIPKLY
jgi:protein-S-isoprenylcysteine O-methyltransferase Ste14